MEEKYIQIHNSNSEAALYYLQKERVGITRKELLKEALNVPLTGKEDWKEIHAQYLFLGKQFRSTVGSEIKRIQTYVDYELYIKYRDAVKKGLDLKRSQSPFVIGLAMVNYWLMLTKKQAGEALKNVGDMEELSLMIDQRDPLEDVNQTYKKLAILFERVQLDRSDRSSRGKLLRIQSILNNAINEADLS